MMKTRLYRVILLIVFFVINIIVATSSNAEYAGTNSIPGNYPETSTRQFTSDELSRYSKDDLTLMRNEIYARHGYIFKSNKKMMNHFNSQPWYQPRNNNVDSMLTRLERDNIELIRQSEKTAPSVSIPVEKTATSQTQIVNETVPPQSPQMSQQRDEPINGDSIKQEKSDTNVNSNANTSHKEENTASVKDKNSFTGEHWFMIFILFAISVITMYAVGINLHGSCSLNIFVDYTDALMTMAGVLIPFLLFIFAKDAQSMAFKLFALLISIIILFFPIKSAFIYNPSAGMGVLALTIKFFTSFMYFLGIFFIILGSSSSKKDGESEASYQRRRERSIASSRASMGIHSLIFMWIVHKTSRLKEFSGETLNMSFDNQFAQLMTSAVETED